MTTKHFAVGVFAVLAAIGAALAEEKKTASIESAKVDCDCQIQGEYTWAGDTPQGVERYGVQVVALGGGEFVATRYVGGLPGAGAELDRRIRIVPGHTVNGETTFVERQTICTASKDGSIVVKHAIVGLVVGKLEKVRRSSPTLGAKPPKGAILLFDGKSTEAFEKAQMTEKGLLKAGAVTKQRFRDFTLHLEFRLPLMPTARGKQRGNSGVVLPAGHEVQILDSFGLVTPQNDSCGAICGLRAPDVNMCFPPLAWQTLDIDVTAPRFDGAGEKATKARITVRHNGELVHNNAEISDVTPEGTASRESGEPGPLTLLDQGSPVCFRNVWIKETR